MDNRNVLEERRPAARSAAVGTKSAVPAWILLALVCLGQFMVVLDISIVNVALPSIQGDLGFSPSALQWVVNAYTLTFAGFLLLGGRAADIFGRRRMFLVGLGMFTVASLVGGLAQSQGMLIVARALQGLGGAVLAPATLTILTTTFSEGAARARALGVWSAVAAGGASAGALLGGVLTELISWRWILFVNVPVGVVTLVAARAWLPESRAETGHRRLDAAGALTVTGGLVAVVYGIVSTETYGWTSPRTLVPLAAGLALVATFLFVQARVARAPLMPLRIFRSRNLTAGNVYLMLLFAAMFGTWFFETLFMQRVLGYSPLAAGLAFLPQTILIAVGSQVASRLVVRLGSRPMLLAGTLSIVAGVLWLTRITPESTFVGGLLGPFLLVGTGMGLSITPATVAATAGVPAEDAGLASGLLNTSRFVGASIGLAVLATVAAARTTALLAGSAPTPSRVAAALTDGYSRALLVGAGFLVAAAAVAALAIPPLRQPAARPHASGPIAEGADEAELIPLFEEQPEALESA